MRRWRCGEETGTIQMAHLQEAANGDIILTRSEEARPWYDRYYFFPLPFSEINMNPNLTQNPGWETTSNNQ